MGRRKKYNTEEERKAAQREAIKRWKEEHPDYMVEWRKNNADKIKAYFKRWQEEIGWNDYMAKYMAKRRLNKDGRAKYLELNYKRLDEENNRGECTLTKEWIVKNIFNQPCHYCGETDWRLLGADRIDNTKPHTPENVVPCCSYCNAKKHTTPYDEYMRMIGKIA